MIREDVIYRIKEIHHNDDEQIKFILSEDKRLLVTAPAGCGKTKSMISKIAFEIANKTNKNFKRILALTFSVNAATKIKEDTAKLLPVILKKNNINLAEELDVSNYHGFSSKLIHKHGYLYHDELKNIDNFIFGSEDMRELRNILLESELNIIKNYDRAIKNLDVKKVDELEEQYFNILINRLIPKQIMTYNGLLLLGYKLLDIETIRLFYQKYYSLIIIDEFQDTNYLAYKLINKLISNNNKLVIMGDDIQKIYGFLGAIPNLFHYVKNKYNMIPIELKTNYRFKDNEKMKNLDIYLRQIFREYKNIEEFSYDAEINLGFYDTDEEEADAIVDNMIDKISKGNKIALLARQKKNADNVIKKLEVKSITYFNALFSDTDYIYIKFHKLALEKFIMESGHNKSVSKRTLDRVIIEVENQKELIVGNQKELLRDNNILFNSLTRLLKLLFINIRREDLSREEKYNKIIYVLSNNSLKRLINEIEDNIILTTIHGSKGLEWDFIYIPEVIKSNFPHYGAMCKDCIKNSLGLQYRNFCKFIFSTDLQKSFEDEFSLFYVGITRAKKDVYLFANVERNRHGYPKKLSCLTTLPNLKMNLI